MMPRVHAVIVHHGPGAPCFECLESIRASRGVRVRVAVVDNNPVSDRSLAERVAAVGGTYVGCPENRGYAGGANHGLRTLAARDEADVDVLLNPDVRLETDCLALLHEALARDERSGVVGPGLRSAAQPWLWWNVGSEVRWPSGRPRSLRHGSVVGADVPAMTDVGYVCGAVLAFRPELLDLVGYLPEEYHLYFEDADFCFRVRRAQRHVRVVPEAIAWHLGGGSVDRIGLEADYYRVRNRLLFSRRWNPHRWRGRLHRVAFGARTLARAALRRLRGDRGAALLARGVIDSLRVSHAVSPRLRKAG